MWPCSMDRFIECATRHSTMLYFVAPNKLHKQATQRVAPCSARLGLLGPYWTSISKSLSDQSGQISLLLGSVRHKVRATSQQHASYWSLQCLIKFSLKHHKGIRYGHELYSNKYHPDTPFVCVTRRDGWMGWLPVSLFWEIGKFEPWSSQTSDLKIDTCHFLARHSALWE